MEKIIQRFKTDFVNSAAVNIGVHASLQIMVFSGYMPRSGTAGSHDKKITMVTKGENGVRYKSRVCG